MKLPFTFWNASGLGRWRAGTPGHGGNWCSFSLEPAPGSKRMEWTALPGASPYQTLAAGRAAPGSPLLLSALLTASLGVLSGLSRLRLRLVLGASHICRLPLVGSVSAFMVPLVFRRPGSGTVCTVPAMVSRGGPQLLDGAGGIHGGLRLASQDGAASHPIG